MEIGGLGGGATSCSRAQRDRSGDDDGSDDDGGRRGGSQCNSGAGNRALAEAVDAWEWTGGGLLAAGDSGAGQAVEPRASSGWTEGGDSTAVWDGIGAVSGALTGAVCVGEGAQRDLLATGGRLAGQAVVPGAAGGRAEGGAGAGRQGCLIRINRCIGLE